MSWGLTVAAAVGLWVTSFLIGAIIGALTRVVEVPATVGTADAEQPVDEGGRLPSPDEPSTTTEMSGGPDEEAGPAAVLSVLASNRQRAEHRPPGPDQGGGDGRDQGPPGDHDQGDQATTTTPAVATTRGTTTSVPASTETSLTITTRADRTPSSTSRDDAGQGRGPNDSDNGNGSSGNSSGTGDDAPATGPSGSDASASSEAAAGVSASPPAGADES